MATYKTTKVKFEELEKKLNRVFKKLNAVGGTYFFQKVRDYVDDVPYYTVDELTQTKYKVGDVRVECVEFVLSFPEYKVGDYRVGAIVERTESDENLVYTVDETVDFKDYITTTIRCDHCGTNHFRRQAVVLVNNNDDTHMMVGKGYLKDYMGIDIHSFAHYLYGISEYLEDAELEIRDNEMHLYKQVVDTELYLAYCIQRTVKFGYQRETTKEDAMMDYRKSRELDPKYTQVAKEMVEFFNNYETNDPFENNVRLYVTGKTPITCENGLIAYAYTLYIKIQERLAKEAARRAQKEKSGYVGEVGQKITFVGKMSIIHSYQTQWGWTNIYKIVDTNNNVFIWKTSVDAEIVDENGHCKFATEFDQIRITGKIKDHNEYDGEKQTVLERCKVMAVT